MSPRHPINCLCKWCTGGRVYTILHPVKARRWHAACKPAPWWTDGEAAA